MIVEILDLNLKYVMSSIEFICNYCTFCQLKIQKVISRLEFG
jgi:hypothetical protein